MDIVDPNNSSYKAIKLDSSLMCDLYELHCKIYPNPVPKPAFVRKFQNADGRIKAIGFCSICSDTNQMVAYYGVFPGQYSFRGKDIIAAQSGDTMTHPKHRGKGLFVALAKLTYVECKNEGIAFVWGIPNSSSASGFYRKLGWKLLYSMKSIRIIIPTLPVALVLGRSVGIGEKLYRSYVRKLAKILRINPYSDLRTNAVIPDNELLVSKRIFDEYGDHQYEFIICELGVAIARLKIAGWMKIGYIRFPSSAFGCIKLVGKLVLFAFLSGSFLIRYYFSENIVQVCNLPLLYFPVKDSLTCGAVVFNDGIDINHLAITYCDYDTY